MKRLALFLVAMLWAAVAVAGSYQVAWDANPPAENVTAYSVFVNGVQKWTGPDLQAPVVAVAGDKITVRARNLWGESGDSLPLTIGTSPSAPTGVKVVNVNVTVNVN